MLRRVVLPIVIGLAAAYVTLEVLGPLSSGRLRDVEFGRVTAIVTVTDGSTRTSCMLLARTGQQLRRGLMEVTDPDLGGYAGMVFDIGSDNRQGFWMRDTPMPLTVTYFDAHGDFVSTADMSPCQDRADCPTYPPADPYRYAVETTRGHLAGATHLSFGSPACQPA
jgi:uncharacterized membrane protein (UPF0127 family)